MVPLPDSLRYQSGPRLLFAGKGENAPPPPPLSDVRHHNYGYVI